MLAFGAKPIAENLTVWVTSLALLRCVLLRFRVFNVSTISDDIFRVQMPALFFSSFFFDFAPDAGKLPDLRALHGGTLRVGVEHTKNLRGQLLGSAARSRHSWRDLIADRRSSMTLCCPREIE